MKIKNLKFASLLFGSLSLVSMTLVKNNLQEPWKVPKEYQEMKNPYAGFEDEDRIGRYIYSKHCKLCHGSKGKGDGNQANLLKTKVADFTTDSFKNQPDGSIYYKLKTGRNEMTSFEKIIPDEEDFWMVVNYIKGL